MKWGWIVAIMIVSILVGYGIYYFSTKVKPDPKPPVPLRDQLPII